MTQCSRRQARLLAARRALRAKKGPGSALRLLNRRRYEAIHDMARSRNAGELVANMWDRSDFYIRLAYGEFVLGEQMHRCNQEICSAIINSESPTVAHLTEDYLERVGVQVARRLTRGKQTEMQVLHRGPAQ